MSTNTQQTYYFGAGPAVLPREVLTTIQEELLDFCGSGLSILELSHRSEIFVELLTDAECLLRELMCIPADYAILFLHGGATAQYSMLPLNFIDKKDTANYICTGHWSNKAAEEAKKYTNVNVIQALEKNEKISIKPAEQWHLCSDASYLHYCDNETINGVAFQKSIHLECGSIFCDMTSSILTRDIDVKDYDLIYASAQKNLGIAGLCVMIIKKDLLSKVHCNVPRVFDYRRCFENKSLTNTPPIFAIYVLRLMLKWLKAQGGVDELNKCRKLCADEIYSLIDNSGLYKNHVDELFRSNINIPFTIDDKQVQKIFLQQAEKNNLLGLRGHKSVGGIRVSLYNAIQPQGVKKLIEFLEDFESSHGS